MCTLALPCASWASAHECRLHSFRGILAQVEAYPRPLTEDILVSRVLDLISYSYLVGGTSAQVEAYPRPLMEWTEQLYNNAFKEYGEFRLRENGTCKCQCCRPFPLSSRPGLTSNRHWCRPWSLFTEPFQHHPGLIGMPDRLTCMCRKGVQVQFRPSTLSM